MADSATIAEPASATSQGAPMGAAAPAHPTDLAQLTINTIRTLSMDAVQAANSGHPGTPMAMAPVAYTLWQEFLRFDPADPIWPNRDRFVLSAGHASMLLYSLLYLTGVRSVDEKYEVLGTPSVSLEDIKHFRQLGSKAPGHPEYHLTSGVETTTGPLGQGVATSVGMAIAERWLAQYFNRPDFTLIDYDVFALCGDGDMMEGVSGEAASLAGHLRLSDLCWIYDNNHITIEGKTNLAFSEDVATRFLGYHWNVLRVGDANDLAMLRRAFTTFKATTDRPTLIIVDSHIGYGAPHLQDTSAAHGEPLGDEEVRLTKRAYGWPEDAKFYVPDGVIDHLANGFGRRGRELHAKWDATFAAYRNSEAVLADQFERMQRRELPDGWDRGLPTFAPDPKGMATRGASEKVLNVIAQNVPWLIGGAADVGTSTKTYLTFGGAGDFESGRDGFGSYAGRNFHYGIREHEMAAASNGLALSKIRPYASTYLIFSDYAKPAIRLSAIMEIPVVYIFTHDSIGLGEDGPTHQPIEQLAALRAIPGLTVIRPADANEVTEAWRVVMQLRHEPAALVLTRQADSRVRPHSLRSGFRTCARRLRNRGIPGRAAKRAVACHGKRGRTLPERVRAIAARRYSLPSSEHAVVRPLRATIPRIPRPGVAAVALGSRRGGAGGDVRMGAICRTYGRHDWYDHIRCVRSARAAAAEVWLHGRQRGSRREGPGRKTAHRGLVSRAHQRMSTT